MRDLLLRLTHDAVIRGSRAHDADPVSSVFSVFDFIDVVGRPPAHNRKRGAFSRDVWARLTSPQSRFRVAIVALAVDAPIRASVKVRRSTSTPCMTVPALQTLMHFVELDLQNFLRVGDNGANVRRNAADTLARFVAGDRSMLEEIPVRSDKRSAVKRKLIHDDDVVDAEIHAKKIKHTSTANTDTPDLILHLTPGKVVRGTITPDTFTQVFSVYDFIDVVDNQLSRQPKCPAFSRYLWKRLTHKNFPYRADFVYSCVYVPIRCNMKTRKRVITPAMTILGLRRILEFVYSESHKTDGQGLRQKKRRCPMEYETRNTLETIFEKIKTGDHTMIEKV